MAMLTITEKLVSILDDSRVEWGEKLRENYSHIWHMDVPLHGKAICYPETATEISEIIKFCHAEELPIVVFGGRTNLVGGTETTGEEVILSMERMNKIESLDVLGRTIQVQAGVILEDIHKTVDEHSLMFPLNFGARGSAQIGGVIASNAGGLRVFRFGTTRAQVLGLEMVLADGSIINSLKTITKDNTGLDLKQLFIGTEGTLGIITRAVLRLIEKPTSRNSAMAIVDDYTQVLNLLKHMEKGLAGTLSGFELMWPSFYETATNDATAIRPPLPHGGRYYVLMESLGAESESDKQRMEDLLIRAMEEGMVSEGIMAHTQSDLKWFWTIRENVHAISTQCQYDQHFDISLPVTLIGGELESILTQLKTLRGVHAVYVFGHVADGNIHLIVDKEDTSDALRLSINDIVYTPLKDMGGSISAEHGIGIHKKAYLHLSRSEEELALMKLMKITLDPKGILNPGKILD